MPEIMKLLKRSQNTAYRVRRELLKHYHEQDSAHASQYGGATARAGKAPPSTSKKEMGNKIRRI